MEIQLIGGRYFDSSDQPTSLPTIIINEALARRYFPDEDPVGKRIKFSKPAEQGAWRTIVGVVRNEKQDSLSADPKPEIYQSTSQSSQNEMTLVIRTGMEPETLIGAVRQEIKTLDKDLPLYDIKTMNDLVHGSVSRERFTTLLLVVFAGLALLLASVGIYGVMSYTVTQRTHEIGIRMALGAQTGDIFREVAGQSFRLAGAGVAIGLAGAFALTRLMAGLLYGVSTTDPLTFVLIALLLTGVSLVASYIPARRATKVDAMVALRYE